VCGTFRGWGKGEPAARSEDFLPRIRPAVWAILGYSLCREKTTRQCATPGKHPKKEKGAPFLEGRRNGELGGGVFKFRFWGGWGTGQNLNNLTRKKKTYG